MNIHRRHHRRRSLCLSFFHFAAVNYIWNVQKSRICAFRIIFDDVEMYKTMYIIEREKEEWKKGYACTKFCYSLNINGSLFFSLFLHLSVLFRCSLEHINISTQRYGLEIIRFENVDFWRRRALHESNDLKIAQRESALILCSFRLWPDLLVLCMCLC